MSAVTQWFDGSVKPAHVGYYQRKYGMRELILFPDYWDGKVWFMCGAIGDLGRESYLELPWRGLAVKP